MRSVVDRLRAEDRQALAALSPAERVAVAFALGARDLEAFRAAQRQPLTPGEAARVLERRRQVARRPSRCLTEIVG